LARHFDNLADLADLKRGSDVRVLLHFDCDVGADEVLKPLFFRINPVLTGYKIHKGEEPVIAAGLGALLPRTQIGERDGGIGDSSAGCVRNRAAYGTICALRVQGKGGRNK